MKISCAGCLGLSSGISSQFTFEMCTAANNCEKFTKPLSFGNSRSFKVIEVNKAKKPVISSVHARYAVHCTRQKSLGNKMQLATASAINWRCRALMFKSLFSAGNAITPVYSFTIVKFSDWFSEAVA